MAIIFDEEKRVFALHTKNTTYMIGLSSEPGYVGHIYYGRKLEDAGASYLLRTGEPPFTPSVHAREKGTFMDVYPFEYPAEGTGDYREPCLTVRTEAGHRVCELHYRRHEIYDGKPGLLGLPATFGRDGGCQTLDIYCEDEVIGLEVQLRYSIFDDSDAIMRSVCVRNVSDKKVYLERVLSACLDMDNEQFEQIALAGSWARERHIGRRPLTCGQQGVSSVRGESSHQMNPFLALATPETTQDTGEVYAMNFVYSGNFLAQTELTQHDTVRMVMGIHPRGFCWRLLPGESFQAPEAVLVYSDAGLGKMTKTFHDLYRNHLIRSRYLHEERPVLINNWEATYFDFDSDKLLAIAREAKKSGIEMLVMDDGWFGRRNADDSSLGDWYVNEEKLKGGLKKLVDEVKALGMKFGIWFEPEMISPDSDLYREHPDWAIQVPGREPVMSRQQYVLDLSRPEVADYAYECVASILRQTDIDYVKWDMNRQLTDIGSAHLEADCQGELLHRYVLGLYRMQERLVTEFPDLLLENCSGGGARFDAGMLYYSPQIWCSDDTDAAERLAIQEGTALVYPLSTMGAHISDCPNHIVGRQTPFETRGYVALAGTFGYELDITKIPEAERAQIGQQVDMYHKYNELVREGDYDRIASFRENHLYDCWQVTAKDASEALVTYIQVLAEPNHRSRRVRLKNLQPDARYWLEDTGDTYSGALLMNAGILVPSMKGDYAGKLYHFVKVE
ncbi:alpha-galactosidase [Marvinbryantia formatexigens DSM 14469]|uniref:Alpha-galactosidase n=1 Tax=Marvinbryantia formatexigens DSM 14469 TaxID=478749 RepID=C6LEZ3_9FIRM|nr:alpha-galactosidase [Marvinbryantia formatexigens]EET60732.1 alpha-galactosidase [Marvinbryantia formatexigens DSM 14469]UWO22978.1 alpha-galactosidase [Marvinbryantia formatexigens DSM 14469]SDG34084.1 alpha-galactosidase [Marvinbryantia formatexigens]